MRYIVDDQFFRKSKKNGLKQAPILFYTGNEANIELFFNTSGF